VGLDAADAALEAEVLLRHAAGVTREELLARPAIRVADRAAASFADLVARREAGVPVAYLVGRREFFGLDLVVDGRVMIPRPETERLVEVLIDAFRDHPAPMVVDVGTGSGAIAIAVAHRLPRARVLATDVSPDALAVARINAARCGVARRIAWARGAGLEPLAPLGIEGSVDAVVSNPPYIPSPEIARLPREIREHEPAVALDGGPDGLRVLREVIAGASRYLVSGGVLALEVAAMQDQAATVAALIAGAGGFDPAKIVRDYAGMDRVVLASRSGDGRHRG
jgi:release factor glutamine methyltransferase